MCVRVCVRAWGPGWRPDSGVRDSLGQVSSSTCTAFLNRPSMAKGRLGTSRIQLQNVTIEVNLAKTSLVRRCRPSVLQRGRQCASAGHNQNVALRRISGGQAARHGSCQPRDQAKRRHQAARLQPARCQRQQRSSQQQQRPPRWQKAWEARASTDVCSSRTCKVAAHFHAKLSRRGRVNATR